VVLEMKEKTDGIVFNIQRYSIHDGPGIRTVVFLKGCPLRCEWCCNPESQAKEPEPELRHTGEKNIIGWKTDVEEVMAQVLKDRNFYRHSGGGVTISGGEPFFQAEFTKELLRRCYEVNIHTALETTGYAEWPVLESVLPYTDLLLYDIKHMDSSIHKKLTGVPNERILANAENIMKAGKQIIVRIPLLPQYNGTEENIRQLLEFLKETGISEVHLMPFHQLGKDKYKSLGRPYALADLKPLKLQENGSRQMMDIVAVLEKAGLDVKIGG
jgi:glycyl-radical enzyme activating protein family